MIRRMLHPHAELRGGVRTGVGIEVVRSTMIELVALAKLTAYKETDRRDAHSDRYPSDRPQYRVAGARVACCVGYSLVFGHRKLPLRQ